jgi:hypothetical protein
MVESGNGCENNFDVIAIVTIKNMNKPFLLIFIASLVLFVLRRCLLSG